MPKWHKKAYGTGGRLVNVKLEPAMDEALHKYAVQHQQKLTTVVETALLLLPGFDQEFQQAQRNTK